jgi:hypothetical protein
MACSPRWTRTRWAEGRANLTGVASCSIASLTRVPCRQVASWLVFFALAAGVYAFYVPFVEPEGAKWFLVALYSLLVAAIVALDLYTRRDGAQGPGGSGAPPDLTAAQPADHIAPLRRRCSALDPSDPGLQGATNGEYFCGLCQVRPP